MGWARTLLLGDVGNRLDIGDVETDIQFLQRRLRDNIIEDQGQAQELERLRADTDEMKLVISCLVRLLTKKGVIDEDEIRAVAHGVDSSRPTA